MHNYLFYIVKFEPNYHFNVLYTDHLDDEIATRTEIFVNNIRYYRVTRVLIDYKKNTNRTSIQNTFILSWRINPSKDKEYEVSVQISHHKFIVVSENKLYLWYKYVPKAVNEYNYPFLIGEFSIEKNYRNWYKYKYENYIPFYDVRCNDAVLRFKQKY